MTGFVAVVALPTQSVLRFLSPFLDWVQHRAAAPFIMGVFAALGEF